MKLMNLSDFLPKLTGYQIDRLSEILANLGIVFFASTVVPVFIGNRDWSLMAMGLILSFGFWISSLSLLKLRKEIW